MSSESLVGPLFSLGRERQRMTNARDAKGGPRPRSPAAEGGAGSVRLTPVPAEAFAGDGAGATASAPEASGSRVAVPADTEDDRVLRRVKAGEVDAFAELVRRYGPRVNGAVARHVPRDQREEVVQDTWVRAYQSLHGFQPGTRFGDWLAGIAVRASYDFWRQHYRRREVPESALGESHREWIETAGAEQSADNFSAHVRREEAQEVLRYALDQVSPEDRMVVSLVHLEGLSAQEAAQRLGWSVVNVKVRAHRSRRRMRLALEAWLGKETR